MPIVGQGPRRGVRLLHDEASERNGFPLLRHNNLPPSLGGTAPILEGAWALNGISATKRIATPTGYQIWIVVKNWGFGNPTLQPPYSYSLDLNTYGDPIENQFTMVPSVSGDITNLPGLAGQTRHGPPRKYSDTTSWIQHVTTRCITTILSNGLANPRKRRWLPNERRRGLCRDLRWAGRGRENRSPTQSKSISSKHQRIRRTFNL